MKKYLFYLVFGVLLITGNSCNKNYLDTEPSDQISNEEIFESITNVKTALNGTYRILYLQLADQEQDGQTAIMIDMDFMGEDIVHQAAGTTYFRNTYKWTDHRSVSGDLPYFVYRFYYKVIANANLILDGIDTVPSATDADKNPIKGECLALRAWAYSNLVQLFGKRYDKTAMPNVQLAVPLLTKYSLSPQPRATVEEVYTQINKDLDQAIIYLAGASARGQYRTHIDISVAKGIKARVALTQQNWVDAAKYAQEAVAGYNLMSNTDYLGGFTDMKNIEWMWGAHQLPDQLPSYGSFYAYMSSNFNSAHTRPNPKKINIELYNKISATDIRKKLWCNNTSDYVNYPGVIDASTGQPVPTQVRALYMHKKFYVEDPAVSAGDIPFMRAAEMYLIVAEAKAQDNLLQDAVDIIYVLAKNRDPSYNAFPAIDQGQVLDHIWTQRRVELWGEGFRFLDLKRLNLPLARPTNTGATTTLATTTNIPAGDPKWQFLIPRREIETNPFIIQNP